MGLTHTSGFKVLDLGLSEDFRVWGLVAFGVWGFGVDTFGFKGWGLGLEWTLQVQNLGLGYRQPRQAREPNNN